MLILKVNALQALVLAIIVYFIGTSIRRASPF